MASGMIMEGFWTIKKIGARLPFTWELFVFFTFTSVNKQARERFLHELISRAAILKLVLLVSEKSYPVN